MNDPQNVLSYAGSVCFKIESSIFTRRGCIVCYQHRKRCKELKNSFHRWFVHVWQSTIKRRQLQKRSTNISGDEMMFTVSGIKLASSLVMNTLTVQNSTWCIEKQVSGSINIWINEIYSLNNWRNNGNNR